MNLKVLKYWLKNPNKLGIKFFRIFGGLWTDKFYLEVLYRWITGEKLNLTAPKTFNEKLQWLKLYDRRDDYTQMVDKCAVKKYVSDRIGEEYIIPTLGVWNSFEEINFNELPEQFVLKTTHDSGGIIICTDKKNFDIKKAKKILTQSLKQNYYLAFREWPYKNVPHRIIAEKFMVDESGKELKDYKFFCFDGIVKFLKVDFDRFVNHHANYYSPQWELLDLGEAAFAPQPEHKIEKPRSLEDMIKIAQILSQGITFVRIDLYDINDKIYFGEITFFPATGMGKLIPEGSNERLGELIKLPI